MLPHTKIVATIGPACWDEPTLRELIAAGVSVMRFNFSHAEPQSTADKIALVRRIAAEQVSTNVAILADLQGPRIRIGALPPEGVVLVVGTTVTLSTKPESMPEAIPVDYPGLAADIASGDTILLDDGLIVLKVRSVNAGQGKITCDIIVGGLLTSHKGINVPDRPLSVPTLTAKDRADLAFALDQGVDLVALSFVRTGSDVREARELIAELTTRAVPVIAKIEKRAAVENFGQILEAADGIMVARGDLGVEMPAEVLPAIQKRIIRAANLAGKPVITATQMLDSMIRNPRPTRAEATDVANAVLDGSDAIMLSGETAVGKYPLAAVQTMARIAHEAEKLFDYDGWSERMAPSASRVGFPEEGGGEQPGRTEPPDTTTVTEVICRSADRIGDELGASAIIAITESGLSARLVAKYRPRSALIAITDRLTTQRALAVTWGVHALLLDQVGDSLITLAEAEQLALSLGLVSPGDLLVFTGGLPQHLPGRTNLLKVQVAGGAIKEKETVGAGQCVIDSN